MPKYFDDPKIQSILNNLKEMNELQAKEIEDLQVNYKNSIMAQWIESILDKWIYSRRGFESDKYWKIVEYYAITSNDRRYRSAMSLQDVKYVFRGYTAKIWEDDGMSFYVCEEESLNNFDFNRYQILYDLRKTDILDAKLAKQLLEGNIPTISINYDFEDYF